ncbi:isoprenyl transferase [Sphingomonas morindae]|uniref:isoprenyl transferase n=1 Tax=Sphingomonas morindae TaxID=1541170 RepID=UPI003F5D5408
MGGFAAAAPESGGAAGVPRHVAIIMDGNGRWAKARRLPRIAGHRKGAEAVRATVRAAHEIGIEALTLYAFSSENWRRPATEIADLMGLLRHYIRAELAELARNGVRLRVIGDWRKLEPDIVTMLDEAITGTAGNAGLTLTIALNYGAQDELLRVTRDLMRQARSGAIDPEALTETMIEDRLDTAGLPRLDLLIRTSGEQRLSNFLLWQAAYAELVFTDRLWPDFDKAALLDACAVFARRERRYGGL